MASEHTSLSQLVLAALGLEVGVRSPVQVVGWRRYSPAVVPWLHPPNILLALLPVGSGDGGEVPVAGGSAGVKLPSGDDPRAGVESTTTQLLLNQLPGNQKIHPSDFTVELHPRVAGQSGLVSSPQDLDCCPGQGSALLLPEKKKVTMSPTFL